MVRTFLDFPVYRKGLKLAGEIAALCNKTKGGQFNFLKDQIRRASSSIILNIAEGSGKWSKKDKINFYRMSLASTNECIAAIDLMFTYKLIEAGQAKQIKERLRDIALDLYALKRSIEKR